jgi:hypothetical protein
MTQETKYTVRELINKLQKVDPNMDVELMVSPTPESTDVRIAVCDFAQVLDASKTKKGRDGDVIVLSGSENYYEEE